MATAGGVKVILSSVTARISRKFRPNRVPSSTGVRFYRGSNRDIRRREWNKKMQEMKKQGPRRFDFKKFISANYEKELSAFAHRLGITPDSSLLRQSLIHRSFLNDGDTAQHNGKLAVLGFNVASQIISSFLFLSYPNFPSYGMRTLQEYLLSQEMLVDVARSLSIPELIKTEHDLNGAEEITDCNLTKDDIIADSLLALIAAIHVQEGSSQSNAFVRDFIIIRLYGQEVESIIKFKNPETALTALLQQQHKDKPVARLINSSGKHTETPVYVVGIFSSDKLLAKVASPILEKAKYEAYCSALTSLLASNMPQQCQSFDQVTS